jgi:hypothetical protein
MRDSDRASFLEDILGDLEREILYADRKSALYGDVFRGLRTLFCEASSGGAPHPCDGALEFWNGKARHAWFERPLLLAAALHRVALSRVGAPLRRFYATCGGVYDPGVDVAALSEAIRATLGHDDGVFLQFLRTQSLQTNEVSRGLTWLLPAATLWLRSQKPIVLVEIGCSAGLNLMADQYGWSIRSEGWAQNLPGAPRIEAKLEDNGLAGLAHAAEAIPEFGRVVLWRVGVDLRIPDLNDPDARAMLEAMIWADDAGRHTQLRQAIDTFRSARSGCVMELREGSAIDAIPEIATALAGRLRKRSLIVFFNTVVTCYFEDASYSALREAIATAASGALRGHEVAWIEHEPKRPGAPSVAEPSAESLIALHRPDGGGGLQTDGLGWTEMHPKTLHFTWSGA